MVVLLASGLAALVAIWGFGFGPSQEQPVGLGSSAVVAVATGVLVGSVLGFGLLLAASARVLVRTGLSVDRTARHPPTVPEDPVRS